MDKSENVIDVIVAKLRDVIAKHVGAVSVAEMVGTLEVVKHELIEDHRKEAR